MKSFIAFAVISLAASFSNAVPVCEPSTIVTATVTTTIDGPSPTSATPFATPTGPPFTPSLPLKSFQLPVTLPNGVVALSPYLQIKVDQAAPDTRFLEIQQIGPNIYFAFEFNSTHAGKKCRFHFSFSVADGSNPTGQQEVYALTSGMVHDRMTFNSKPVSGDKPIAAFLPTDSLKLGEDFNQDSLLQNVFKSDFDCPTQPTGWETRSAGTPGTNANWSWNHGLIIEVLDETKPWYEGSTKW